MFIERLEFKSNIDLVEKEINDLVSYVGWKGTQLGLKHRVDAVDIWGDAIGSLYCKKTQKFIAFERDFTEWSLDNNSYIKKEILNLSNYFNFQIGRVRAMKLNPRTGLSVHYDSEVRYHFVVKTNNKSYICNNIGESNSNLEVIAQCYNLPANSYWYKVDTRQTHWVYNGGDTERIHIVVCEV